MSSPAPTASGRARRRVRCAPVAARAASASPSTAASHELVLPADPGAPGSSRQPRVARRDGLVQLPEPVQRCGQQVVARRRRLCSTSARACCKRLGDRVRRRAARASGARARSGRPAPTRRRPWAARDARARPVPGTPCAPPSPCPVAAAQAHDSCARRSTRAVELERAVERRERLFRAVRRRGAPSRGCCATSRSSGSMLDGLAKCVFGDPPNPTRPSHSSRTRTTRTSQPGTSSVARRPMRCASSRWPALARTSATSVRTLRSTGPRRSASRAASTASRPWPALQELLGHEARTPHVGTVELGRLAAGGDRGVGRRQLQPTPRRASPRLRRSSAPARDRTATSMRASCQRSSANAAAAVEQVGRLEGMRNARDVDRTRGFLHVHRDIGGCALALLPVGGVDEDVVAVGPVQPDTAVVPGQERRRIGERDRTADAGLRSRRRRYRRRACPSVPCRRRQ